MIAICEFCNREYSTFKNWYDRVKHHTCSIECASSLKTKLTEKSCLYCGTIFSRKSHQYERKFCSSVCQNKFSHENPKLHLKTCKECSKEFFVSHEQINKHYCSVEYRDLSRYKVSEGICLQCKSSFKKDKSDYKFCSYNCFRQFSDEHSLEQELSCVQCGTKFLRNPGQIKKAKNHFCSSTCKYEYNRGKNHYEWKESPHDKHEKLALKQWAIQIKKRDNYICQYCGDTNKDLLEAHHLQSRSDFSNLKFDISNGVTLCVNCHAEEHKSNNVIHNLILNKLVIYENKKKLDTVCN